VSKRLNGERALRRGFRQWGQGGLTRSADRNCSVPIERKSAPLFVQDGLRSRVMTRIKA
jgi:hypothetical protein